jgi:hypothetical protein
MGMPLSSSSTRLGRTPFVEPANLDHLLHAIEKVAVRSMGQYSVRDGTNSS